MGYSLVNFYSPAQLGRNLIIYLLHLIVDREEEADQISALALDCLVRRFRWELDDNELIHLEIVAYITTI